MYVATASPRPKRSAFDSSRGGNVPCVPPPWIRHCVLLVSSPSSSSVDIDKIPQSFPPSVLSYCKGQWRWRVGRPGNKTRRLKLIYCELSVQLYVAPQVQGNVLYVV